jgi:pyruvate/2-oxoacid:ferredoxin oxidoreductase beta subunit
LKLIVSAEGSEKNKKKEKRKKEVKKEGRNFINAFSSCECDNKLKMAYCDI